jgi:gamma-glutamyltranspeptidase/glutathione hydrolase
MKKPAFRSAATLTVFLVLSILAGAAGARGQSGMVAAAHPLAIEAGENVLASGGNAIEAAITAAAVLNVVEPYASGIGGGGFMVVHVGSTGQEFVLDSYLSAPLLTTVDMFINPETGRVYPDREINSGGIAVGIPGALKHWDAALQFSRDMLGGTFTLREALQPAIDLATNGFAVSDTFLTIRNRNRTRLRIFPETAAIFFPTPDLVEGSILQQPDLARTLQTIADQGATVFYDGPIAGAIAGIVQRPRTVDNPPYPIHPGRIRSTDLGMYELRRRDVVTGTYRGYNIVTSGPPSGGATLIELLNIVEGFPYGGETYGFLEPNTAHTMIEAMKLSYADRTGWVADPEFVTVPVGGLVSKSYADVRRALIQLDTALPVPQGRGDPRPYGGARVAEETEDELSQEIEAQASTTHLAVVDGDGNMVAYTTTLSELWGSAMVVPGYGFLLNNALRNFTTSGSSTAINRPQPGKRPRSFISPALVFTEEGLPRLVTGSAGGGAIPAIVLGVISIVLDHGKTIQEGIDAPRFVNENRSGDTDPNSDTRYETEEAFRLPQGLIDELTRRLQTMLEGATNFGASQGIAIDPTNGTLTRGADPRRGGEF